MSCGLPSRIKMRSLSAVVPEYYMTFGVPWWASGSSRLSRRRHRVGVAMNRVTATRTRPLFSSSCWITWFLLTHYYFVANIYIYIYIYIWPAPAPNFHEMLCEGCGVSISQILFRSEEGLTLLTILLSCVVLTAQLRHFTVMSFDNLVESKLLIIYAILTLC
jgi:hypothetical protein